MLQTEGTTCAKALWWECAWHEGARGRGATAEIRYGFLDHGKEICVTF